MREPMRAVVSLVMSAVLGTVFFACSGEAPQDPYPVVVMETTMGTIEVTLDAEKAPVTVENFLTYVADSFYDSTIIHRIAPRIVQGGGYDTSMKVKDPTRPPIKNESGNGLSNLQGTIAMALRGDPNSARTQFYFNTRNNAMLDDRHFTVFGRITAGMDVVEKIAALETRKFSRTLANVPVEMVVITSMKVRKNFTEDKRLP